MRAIGIRLGLAILSIVLAPAVPASAQIVESTGFEAEDGWEAGYSICGPEFADTCSYPLTHSCVPNNHAANKTCCKLDPNEDTGWYMDIPSCTEPHIDTIHPFSGLQHLRFQVGEFQWTSAVTPSVLSPPTGRTVVSFEIAVSEDGDGLEWTGRLDGSPNVLIAREIFEDTGGVYRHYALDLDRTRNVLRRCYDGQISVEPLPALEDSASWHHSVFRTRGSGGIWDIDDYSVVRDGSGPACAVREIECSAFPCAALLAVGINGEPIPPTKNVYVQPGNLLETEIRFSGWGIDLPNGVRVYGVTLDLGAAAGMGASGMVLPVGWDASVFPVYCSSAADCSLEYPICSPVYGHCVGASHDPERGAFITTDRSDFIFFGFPGTFVVDVSNLYYRYTGFLNIAIGIQDIGVPRYAGTLMLDVSEDACGTFQYKFRDPDDTGLSTYLQDPNLEPLTIYPSLSSLQVHVCEDDGLFCNGLESCASGSCVITPAPDCDDGNECTEDACDEAADACAHVVICGACCDSWDGECGEAVAEVDCDCQNCIWSPAVECADIACEAEFVAIPTVSQWGLGILTLLLLTGGKVMFGRRLDTLSNNIKTSDSHRS